jgi:PhnB protein
MNASTIKKLTPYLHFDGNCEEAVSTYKSIFNGNLDIKRFETAPIEVPDSHKSNVLHAVFTFGNNTIMASVAIPKFINYFHHSFSFLLR